jgi:hypothetical protein
VQVESDAVVLNYRAESSGSGEWKSVQQRVPIRLTACHLGGQRPWFVCSVYSDGRRCGRRSAIPLWRWRTFCLSAVLRLALPSQQETPMYRGVNRAQKTRMRLGGSPDLLQPFPKRPRGSLILIGTGTV